MQSFYKLILITMILLCSGLIVTASTTTGTTAGPDPALHKELGEQLTTWKQNIEKKQELTRQLQTLDVLSDPERDDRFWWNPFWRASRENQAQRANELTLKIQKIDQQQQQLKIKLLRSATQYSQQALATPSRLSSAQRQLWIQADEWRIPKILQAPAWEIYSPEQFSTQPAELRQKRLQRLQKKQQSWLELEHYLKKYLTHFQPIPSSRQEKYSDWLLQLKQRLEKLDEIFKTLKNYTSARQKATSSGSSH